MYKLKPSYVNMTARLLLNVQPTPGTDWRWHHCVNIQLYYLWRRLWMPTYHCFHACKGIYKRLWQVLIQFRHGQFIHLNTFLNVTQINNVNKLGWTAQFPTNSTILKSIGIRWLILLQHIVVYVNVLLTFLKYIWDILMIIIYFDI